MSFDLCTVDFLYRHQSSMLNLLKSISHYIYLTMYASEMMIVDRSK